MTTTINQALNELAQHYDALATQYGYSPHATQQSSLETQEKRLSILLDVLPSFKHQKVLDFGCGTGHLLSMLQQRGFVGEYVGYDIAPNMLSVARSYHPQGRFELKNILLEPIEEMFDVVFISGVFNNAMGHNEQWAQQVLTRLFAHTREALAFNMLSRYVDFFAEGLYYADPMHVFQFCKENLSARVTLRHDYEIKPGVIPFEFSCYVYAAPHAKVALK